MARRFYEGGPIGQSPTPEEASESGLHGRPTPDKSNAYHEAGHTVAAVAFDIAFDYISIVPDERNWGGVVLDLAHHLVPGSDADQSHNRQLLENLIVLALAGEALLSDREFDFSRPGLGGDLQAAHAFAHRIHSDPGDRDTLLHEMAGRACRFVQDPLRECQIGRVAETLRVDVHEPEHFVQ